MANKDVQVRKRNQASSDFDLFPDLENMMEQFFDSRFGSMFRDGPSLNNRPLSNSNIQEDEKCYVMTAEIPGIPLENIDISVNGNLLTIRAQNKESSSTGESDRGYRRQYRSFQQSYSLPTTVNADQIEAHYENGILELVLPKTEQAQPKKIEIQTGKGGFFDRLLGKNEKSMNSQNSNQDTTAKH